MNKKLKNIIGNEVPHLNTSEALISIFSSEAQFYKFIILEKLLLFLLLVLLIIRTTATYRNVPG